MLAVCCYAFNIAILQGLLHQTGAITVSSVVESSFVLGRIDNVSRDAEFDLDNLHRNMTCPSCLWLQACKHLLLGPLINLNAFVL